MTLPIFEITAPDGSLIIAKNRDEAAHKMRELRANFPQGEISVRAVKFDKDGHN